MKLINIPKFRMGMAVASAIAFIASAPLAQDTLPKLPFEVNVADYSEDVASAYAVAAKRRDWVQAFESQDVERMMSYYVEDIYSYDLMAAPVGDGLELAFDGAEIWETNWVTFFGLFEDDLEVTIEDLTVYQSGDIATVRGLISPVPFVARNTNGTASIPPLKNVVRSALTISGYKVVEPARDIIANHYVDRLCRLSPDEHKIYLLSTY